MLQANLKRLNATALFKQRPEGGKKVRHKELTKAYNEFQDAKNLFIEIGRKSHFDNEGNLGKAICLVGMASIMDKNIWNFTNKHMDEDAALKKIADHFE